MKKITGLLLLAAMLVGLTCTFTSCGTPKDAGAEIAVYIGDPIYDLDPTEICVDDNAAQVMSLLFEPLFSINAKGKLCLAGAKKYRINKETRQIVIDLRETYWSDGYRVTAQDYIYAWLNRLLDPNVSNPAAALLYDVENALEAKQGKVLLYEAAIEQTGMYQIRLTYREGSDPEQLLRNLASIATSPLRENAVNNVETYWSKSKNSLVTNGPFTVSTYEFTSGEFTLARNVGYHQSLDTKNYVKQVSANKLITFWDGDEAVELTYDQVANRAVFYMGNATLSDRAANGSKATVANMLSTYSYLFNMTNPLFQDAHVRKALSLALNREAMASAVTFGKAATALHAQYAGLFSAAADMNAAKAELALADQTLNKAFTLTVNDDEESVAMAELAKAAWEELGFEVTVKTVSTMITTINDRLNGGAESDIQDSVIQSMAKEIARGNLGETNAFDVLAIDFQLYSADAFVALCAFTSLMNGAGVDFENDPEHKGDQVRPSFGGYANEEYDALMDKAFASFGAEREQAVREAEELLCADLPILPILFNQNFAYVSEDISGLTTDGFGLFRFEKVKQANYENYLVKEEK